MDRTPQSILFLLLISSPSAAQNTTGSSPNEFHVGVILDLGSLACQWPWKISMQPTGIAAGRWFSISRIRRAMMSKLLQQKFPFLCNSKAIELLETYKVQAIIGPQKSSEAVFISNLGNTTQCYLLVSNKRKHYARALQAKDNANKGIHCSYVIDQGLLLFTKAKEAGMMTKGFVWIITNGLANIIDSLNPSVIEAMNGVIGLNQNGLKLTMPDSMQQLNPVIWPGESTEVPRGWELPASANKLRVGVHTSAYPEFIKTSKDPVTNATRASGLSIDIFEEAVKRLPFALAYEYQAFDTVDTQSTGSYNDFVYQVYLQRYDIAIGDITIRYNRTMYVDFTIPYTESGVAMIVPVKEKVNNNMWIFLKPLSKGMWFGSIMFFIYTGIVVWLLERLSGNGYLNGPFSLKQLGILMFFSIFEEKEKLECFLSRIVLLVWMFVLLVLASSYTASFASMLLVQQLAPTVTDIHELQKQGAYVGFHRGSYIEGLLEDIGFDRSKIRPYDTPDDFHIALSNEGRHDGVAALVLEVPYIKLFLAKYCKGYTMVGPIYKSAGFAFALPKRSPLLTEISRAILNITEGDSIIQIEKKWIDQNSCQNEEKVVDSGAITFGNFGGLFLLTGLVTTCSLSIALLWNQYKKGQQINIDYQNQQGHGQQEENGHIQDGDQNNEENGGCNDIDNQATTISMTHSPNTNSDQLGDCLQNNKAITLTHFGSQVTHRGGIRNIGDQVAQV
ncbi:unnamed protein product [Miscanthus lutarioriparius]|uniref:Ionotropic glutamate receptor C-terminal domain-containing protein n=1 Tax=Miscanthus lutarioriparius TaxID=422564 RepID=A0A811N7F0_9POAL|nr:unnamed protein product [Miscanthus lutarioriparius]